MLHVEKEEEDVQNGKTLWELDDGETESMESVTFVQRLRSVCLECDEMYVVCNCCWTGLLPSVLWRRRPVAVSKKG